MKKFLSILLAVLMVLSTVSFAVPSAIGAMDSAMETPVVEAPVADLAEEAVLSEVDTSAFGDLKLHVDFNNFAVGCARWPSLADAGGTNYGMGLTATTGVNINLSGIMTTAATAGFVGTGSDGSVAFKHVRNAGWEPNISLFDGNAAGGNYEMFLEPGVYTVTYDIKASNAPYTTKNRVAHDSADTSTVDVDVKVENTDWNTVTATFDATDKAGLCKFYIYMNTADSTTVEIDNIKVYAKKATATVTVKDGDKVLATNTVSTAGTTVAEITAGVKVPGKVITGVVIGGKTYGAADTIVLGGDVEAILVTEKDVWTDATYGTLLVNMDFEGPIDTEGDGTSTYWDKVTELGAKVNPAINNPDQIKTNFNAAGLNGSASPFTIANFVKTDGENHYFEANLKSTWTQYMWGRNTGSAWAPILDDATTAIDKNGIYTYVVDIKTSDTTLVTTGDNFRTGGNVRTDGTATIASNTKGEWATHVFVLDTTTGTAHKDNNGASVAGRAVELVGPSLNTAAASGTIAWDNARLYIKSPYADVTFYPGTNAAVEETTVEVSTGGFKLSEIAIDTSMTSKVLVGAKDADGNEYGMADTIFVGGDAAFTLLWAEPTAESAYGDLAFETNFEALSASTARWPELSTVGGTNYKYGFTSTTGINWNFSGVVSAFSTANIGVGPDGSKSFKHVRAAGWEPAINIYDGNSAGGNYEMFLAPGVYTVTYDVKASNAPYTTKTRVVHDAAQSALMDVDITHNTTDWEKVVATFDASESAGLCMNYFFFNTPANTTVEIDNVKVYVKPATAKVTIDVDGTEYVWENAPTSGVTVADIIAGAGVPVENPYESVNGFTFDGVTYTGADKLSFVKDVKVKALFGKNETLRQDIGTQILVVDFENATNGTQVTGHYNTNKLGVNLADFPKYKGSELTFEFGGSNPGGSVKEEADGNKYLEITNFPNGSYIRPRTNIWVAGDVFADAGYVTMTFDVKAAVDSVQTGHNFEVPFRGTSEDGRTDHAFDATGEWEIFESLTYDADNLGAIAVYAYNSGAVGIDNVAFWWKPAKTTVSFVSALADGTAVDVAVTPKENVDIEGVTVAQLLAGVKVSGYEVTGMKYAGKEYAADATDALTFAQANETVYLTVTKLEKSEYVPVTDKTPDVRAELNLEESDMDNEDYVLGDKSGMRFKATMKTAGPGVSLVGWVVSTDEKISSADELTRELVATGKAVEEFNVNSETGKKVIYASESGFDTFAAVLTGVPEEKFYNTIYAKPFVVDAGGTWYGDAFVGSYNEACAKILSLYEDGEITLTDEQVAALNKVANA